MSSPYTFITINTDGKSMTTQINDDHLFELIPTLEKRDLYILDTKFHVNMSAIQTKKKTILIKLDHIRCVIYNKMAYFVSCDVHDTPEGSYMINLEDDHLFYEKIVKRVSNKKDKLKFRLKIVEEIFDQIVNDFDQEILEIAPDVNAISIVLSDPLNDTDISNKDFIDTHNSLLNLELRLKDIYELFNDLMPEDNINKEMDDGDEEEINDKPLKFYDLISNYIIRFENNYKHVQKMLNIVTTMLEIKQTRLDEKRNKMQLISLYVEVIALGVAMAALLTGVFGMNVPNFLDESDIALGIIIFFLILLIIIPICFLKIIKKLLI